MALEQASSPGRCRCSEAFARALLAGRPLPDPPPPAAGASSDDEGAGQSFEGAGGRAFRATPAEPVLPVGDSDWLDDPKPTGPGPGAAAKAGSPGIGGTDKGRSDGTFTGHPAQPTGFSAGGFWLVEADPMPSLTCGPRTFWLAARPAKVSRSALTMASLASLESGESVPQSPTSATASRSSGSTSRSRLARPTPPAETPAMLNLASLRAVQLAVSGNVHAKMGEMTRVSGDWLEAARAAGWSSGPRPPLPLPETGDDCREPGLESLGGPLGATFAAGSEYDSLLRDGGTGAAANEGDGGGEGEGLGGEGEELDAFDVDALASETMLGLGGRDDSLPVPGNVA